MESDKKDSKPLFLRLITGKLPKEFLALDESKKYVFILSTGRTGTTYIANYFANYENVYSVHEPKPSWRLRMWSMASLEKNIDTDYLYKIFAKLRKRKTDKIREKIYIESNPFLKGFAVCLAKNIPNISIIHIVRDPRDSITSSINNGTLRLKKRLVMSLIPYWHLRPIKPFAKKNVIIKKIARAWLLTNSHINESGNYADNYMRIRFEDLFHDTEKMKELVNFIGMEEEYIEETKTNFSKKSRNASKYNDIQNWKNWSPSFAKQIDAVLGETMKEYGYGEEKEWQSKINE